MKVAIFSDVQGNLPAMEEAVSRILAWSPDMVVMDGDLLNRGPSSLDCLEFFDDLKDKHGWLPIKGNHETWILRCSINPPKDQLDADMRRFADWTYQQVRSRISAFENWPDHLCFHGGDDASWVHVTHGTLGSNRQGITTSITDEELRPVIPMDVSLFVTAHTHRPLTRTVDGLPIVNVGSVGSPFDGDPRGSYVQLEKRPSGWQFDIIRFDYDRARAEQDFHTHGFIEGGGPLARILFEEWRRARLLMPTWRRDFEPAVLAGERPLQSAVDAFLASID